MMNFASFGGGQQFYPNNNHSMHTLLAAQQFQHLQIHPQKQQQHQFQQQIQQQQQQQIQQQQMQQQQQEQQQQQQQQQQSGDFKMRATTPPCPNDNPSSDANPSAAKDC
jgi:hypothetical protein